jgi:type IV pilus assembly protein PilZ
VPDHRDPPRAPIDLQVDYRKLNSFFADYTRNISKGGTFIKTKKPLPAGTQFLFRLSVPSRSEAFEIIGEVERVETQGGEDGMAIRFLWRDDAERQSFERTVERLMGESLGPQAAAELLALSREPASG